jgi:hypothetical protein
MDPALELAIAKQLSLEKQAFCQHTLMIETNILSAYFDDRYNILSTVFV